MTMKSQMYVGYWSKCFNTVFFFLFDTYSDTWILCNGTSSDNEYQCEEHRAYSFFLKLLELKKKQKNSHFLREVLQDMTSDI